MVFGIEDGVVDIVFVVLEQVTQLLETLGGGVELLQQLRGGVVLGLFQEYFLASAGAVEALLVTAEVEEVAGCTV